MIHEKTTRKRQENRSMKIENRTPHQDGFYMPGEFEPQDGVILIWPKRPGSWPYEAKEAGKVFADILPVKEQVVGLQRGHQAGIL
jgi:agmatine deiminase